jgi:uncharacterized protein (DUF488 family)
MQIFTVGHSNHSIEKFLNLLKQHGVTAVADVRSSPFSRRFPHFNQAPLINSLSSEKISYVFLGEQLGARPKNPECYVEGKARYELIAATEAFATGLERIFRGTKHHQIALMCAEQDPITCHRAILVCKHLRNTGLDVQHILKTGDLEPHEHLEQRLLKLHNLSEVLPLLETPTEIAKSETQLQLFNINMFDTSFNDKTATSYVTLGDVVEQAYQLQGEQIAYVEGHKNKDTTHERAS